MLPWLPLIWRRQFQIIGSRSENTSWLQLICEALGMGKESYRGCERNFYAWRVSRLSQRRSWGFRSSGMWHCGAGWLVTEVLRWEHHAVSKRRAPFIGWRGVTSQKNGNFCCYTHLLERNGGASPEQRRVPEWTEKDCSFKASARREMYALNILERGNSYWVKRRNVTKFLQHKNLEFQKRNPYAGCSRIRCAKLSDIIKWVGLSK